MVVDLAKYDEVVGIYHQIKKPLVIYFLYLMILSEKQISVAFAEA